MKKITIQEVKNAMKDIKFRLTLPNKFKDDIHKYEQNPSCPCNLPIYRRILTEAKDQLQSYYPGKDILVEEDIQKTMQNNFSVINCNISDLETRLRSLPPGRKQIAVARYEDQATVIVNELDLAF